MTEWRSSLCFKLHVYHLDSVSHLQADTRIVCTGWTLTPLQISVWRIRGWYNMSCCVTREKKIWTKYASCVFLGSEELGSGSYGHRYVTDTVTGDDDGFDIDDSDYDIYIEEVNFKIPLWHFCFLYSLSTLKCLILSGSVISAIICTDIIMWLFLFLWWGWICYLRSVSWKVLISFPHSILCFTEFVFLYFLSAQTASCYQRRQQKISGRN